MKHRHDRCFGNGIVGNILGSKNVMRFKPCFGTKKKKKIVPKNKPKRIGNAARNNISREHVTVTKQPT